VAGPWILAATILGSSMVFLDGTVVNVTLPVLQAQLDATLAQVQWIVEAYALFLAALLLLGGALGDRFGRRRIFTIGVGLFAAASIACGASSDAGMLILARAIQGVGGSLLVPGSLAILSASFPEEERGRAIGTWAAFTGITAGLGPVVGGWLAENVSWRWIFFLNVPLAAIVLALCLWRVPESRDEESDAALDWPGALLATTGLGGLVYGLIESGNLGFADGTVVAALAVGTVSLLGFVIVEARSASPMMPLELFRSRTFSGANVLTLLLYSGLAGFMFFLPFNLIQVQGYSVTAAGAAFLPFILLMFLLSRWAGGLIVRYGARLPLIVGPVIAAAGFWLFALPGIGGSYWTTFFPPVVVLGLGMAISVAPLTTTVMNAVDVRHAGVASGINNAVSRTAALLAVAVLGVVFLRAYDSRLAERLSALGIPEEIRAALEAESVELAGAELPAGVEPESRAKVKRAILESFVESFRIIIMIAAGLALASALSAALMIEDRKRAPASDRFHGGKHSG
jgi:EmrB/QacA subfamily drug resistance transporter